MTRRLRIDWEGSARLEGESWQQRCGRSYVLLGSPDQVLLGVDAGEDDECERVPVLAGDLSRVPFPELVHLISQGRLSGVLRVHTASATRQVVFLSGEVRGAASQRVGERFGEILVRLGLLKRPAVDELEREAFTPRAMGRLAVERDWLSERGLWTAAQELVITVFQEILQETGGCFSLCEEDDESTLSVPGLSAEALLMEGVRRLDELRALRSGPAREHSPTQVLAAFNAAFRDIFATSEQAGAGVAIQRAAATVFEDDPAHAAFRWLRFSPEGELAEHEVMALLDKLDDSARDKSSQLSDALSTVMLFLLFVAGEHLSPEVHQGLHSRVNARVNRSSAA